MFFVADLYFAVLAEADLYFALLADLYFVGYMKIVCIFCFGDLPETSVFLRFVW
jgi:hypothetical protein